MAQITLTEQQDCANFFTTAILVNVTYWHSNPAVQSLDVEILDQEREGLIRAIRFGLRVDEAWPTVCQLIETLSPYMERRGYWAVWEQLLDQALNLARQRDDMARGVVFSLLLARLLQRQSKIKETIRYYRQTMKLARRTGDRYNRGRACTNLAYLYIGQGRWQRAERLCYCALSIFEQENNLHGLAHTENHLGILYLQLGQWVETKSVWSKALPHLERACQYWQTRDDTHGLVYGTMNLGMYYLLVKQPQQSIEFSEKALKCADQVGERLLTGSILVNMGLAYQIAQDYHKAEMYCLRAEKIFQQFYNLYELANAQKNLGAIFLEQQKLDKASHYLHSALSHWHKLDNKYQIAETQLYLCECELATNAYQKAKRWLNQAEAILLEEATLSHRVKTHLDKTRCSLKQVAATRQTS
ncbi:MAG: tetratricopeptide repeat protein [Anaerolineae bacterium]|nr:tetratricopeptide repeat protein [Anaerolineae bacterium]